MDVLGESTSICRVYAPEENGAPSILRNLPEHVRWLDEAEGFIARHCTSLTDSERAEMLWRILAGDRSPTSRPADPSGGQNFRHMRTFLNEFHALLLENGAHDLEGLMEAIRNHGAWTDFTTFDDASTLLREMVRGDALFGNRAFPRKMAVGIDTKYLCMVPQGTRTGDIIALFWGSEVPFVLRRSATIEEYQIVGECYVHGEMSGEGLKEDSGDRDFVIF